VKGEEGDKNGVKKGEMDDATRKGFLNGKYL